MEFFLVHPGGPFFRNKDAGAWSVVKGLVEPSDPDPLGAARRELVEETGFAAPEGPYVSLGVVKQKGGKIVEAWAVVAALDPDALVSNLFALEWPPRSGRTARFPEVDRAGWFDADRAREKLLAAQQPFVDRALAARAILFG